ncbi:MAG TPA: hypothetical protein PK816_11410 [Candidatus Cloacimonadota bacterium]|nr:hypothetical protein [Candidatus Cloacimonadota bacterium]
MTYTLQLLPSSSLPGEWKITSIGFAPISMSTPRGAPDNADFMDFMS